MATIVVGTDGSKGSEAALAEGFDLAKRLGAKVLVFAVTAHVSDVLGGSVYKRKLSDHLNRARAALDVARTMADDAGVEAEFETFEGDAAEEIAMIAESRDADLVVVGTRATVASPARYSEACRQTWSAGRRGRQSSSANPAKRLRDARRRVLSTAPTRGGRNQELGTLLA
jgi:nucleotide-binding universal stress UspA family protein